MGNVSHREEWGLLLASKKDRAQIAPKFIFCRNLEVNNTKNKTYEVKNLKELKTKFQAFSRKYFK